MTWRAQIMIYRDGVDLLYMQRWGEELAVAQPVEFVMKTQKANEVIAAPTLHLPDNSGQELFQALWDAGFRPADGHDGGAEAKALRDHIKFAERMADGLLRGPTVE
jgi:hypothetical protein